MARAVPVHLYYRAGVSGGIHKLGWDFACNGGWDMGRKLNDLEGAGLFLSEAEACRQDRTGLSRSQVLQHQIAEQLGISVAELGDRNETPNAVHSANNLVRSTDTALGRECLELLDAYIRIRAPEQRRRCLQAVREAACRSANAGPKTEA
jgi:hypothetical protein